MFNRSVQVLTPYGFNQLFEENQSNFNLPATRAYEKTEDLHEKEFGVRRYSSYRSFSVCRKKVIKK